ncbi:hypothetical protein ACQP2X_39260 [Actinoplanes sp. CA-131856]
MSRLFAAGVLGIALTAATVAPAQAVESPKTNSLTVAYTAPTPYSSIVGGIWANFPVTMHCWVDYAWADGTNRWFYVDGAGYSPYTGRPIMVHGFVSANRIVNQARVDHC